LLFLLGKLFLIIKPVIRLHYRSLWSDITSKYDQRNTIFNKYCSTKEQSVEETEQRNTKWSYDEIGKYKDIEKMTLPVTNLGKENGGMDGTRTRDPLRDRQVF